MLRIPYDRALEFANKEKITDLLYPLFVHGISELLCQPGNKSNAEVVLHEAHQRRMETPRAWGAPHMSSLHHPSLHQPLSQTSRPGVERAHTFPTPPASASSLMSMASQGNGYEYSGLPATQSLPVESLPTARSLPATPATTPPGSNNIHGLPAPYTFESKPFYSAAPPAHPQYAPQQPLTTAPAASLSPYSQSLPGGSYFKNEPRPSITGGGYQPAADVVKSERYSQDGSTAATAGSDNVHVPNGSGEQVSEHETEEYMHDPSYKYSYTNSHAPLAGEQSGIGSGSSSHSTSGRLSQSSGAGGPPHAWASDHYSSPSRTAAGSLYSIVSDTRNSASNGVHGNTYTSPSAAYSTGLSGPLGVKRMRDDDAEPESRDTEFEQKRRRTITTDPTMGGPVGGAPLALQPVISNGIMSRH